jgi:hypothetical protein
MRTMLQKIGAVVLAVGGLTALLAQAALTHGCGGAPADQGGAKAPSAPGEAPEAVAPAHEETEYMGATKAPPMPAFRPSPKSNAGGDVEESEDGRSDNAQQAP